MLEGDYYGSILKIFYVNVISPHITLALHSIMTKLKKRSIFSIDLVRSISKFAKIFLTTLQDRFYEWSGAIYVRIIEYFVKSIFLLV